MPLEASIAIIFFSLGLFLRNLSWQLKSVMRPHYCFRDPILFFFYIRFYIWCICSNLARSKSSQKEQRRFPNLRKQLWQDDQVGETRGREKLLRSNLRNNFAVFKQQTTLLSKHVTHTFIFIASMSSMSITRYKKNIKTNLFNYVRNWSQCINHH